MQAWRTIFNQEGTSLILFVGNNLSPLNELGLRQSTNQTNINKVDHQLIYRRAPPYTDFGILKKKHVTKNSH